ncbi:MAG: GAP family protein [Mycobacterium sp.]|nr:GAP family protein [Mycobacterium sp.]
MGTLATSAAELIPLALVIALSPFSIIPGILVLHTLRPRPTSLAFLAGWTFGIAAITAASVEGSDRGAGNSPGWAPYLRIAVGIGLIALGLYRWLNRRNSTHSPRWMRSLSSLQPGRAFLTAIVLTVANPKVLLLCAAAGAVIGTSELSTAQSWSAAAIFTTIAASSVALPVLGRLFVGRRLDEPLNKLKVWMEDKHAGLIGAILLIIGLALLYKGIHALP